MIKLAKVKMPCKKRIEYDEHEICGALAILRECQLCDKSRKCKKLIKFKKRTERICEPYDKNENECYLSRNIKDYDFFINMRASACDTS